MKRRRAFARGKVQQGSRSTKHHAHNLRANLTFAAADICTTVPQSNLCNRGKSYKVIFMDHRTHFVAVANVAKIGQSMVRDEYGTNPKKKGGCSVQLAKLALLYQFFKCGQWMKQGRKDFSWANFSPGIRPFLQSGQTPPKPARSNLPQAESRMKLCSRTRRQCFVQPIDLIDPVNISMGAPDGLRY